MATKETIDESSPEVAEAPGGPAAAEEPKPSKAPKRLKVPKGCIRVRTKRTDKGLARVMYRGGLRFSAEPRLVKLSELSEGALASIEAEDKLEIRKG